MKLRLPALALTVVALLAVFVRPALAHALLIRSVPETNATLDRPPAQIELFFSEALEPAFSTASVLDSNGARVDNADSRVDPADSTHLTVSIRSLPDGVYTVSWKALSSVDGHVTTGAFPFAVGKVDAAALAAAGQAGRQIKLPLGEVLAKWLLYLSAAALTGGALFILTVWRPALWATTAEAGAPASVPMPWPRLAPLALIILMVAQVFGLLVHAGQASGTEFAVPWGSAVNSVLLQTRYGPVWMARLALGFALAGLLPVAETSNRRPRKIRFEDGIALGVLLLLLLTLSLDSHAAAEPQPILPVLADWVHLLAASVWVGGLICFVAGLRAVRQLDPTGAPASRPA